jgi:hypothetical protein
MACASAANAAALQELAAYLQAAPAPAAPAATPASIAGRLDVLAHANAKAVAGLVTSLNELAQTATNLVNFSAEISACARAPGAGPAGGLPAAAVAAAILPPPAEAAPAAAAPADAIEPRSRHRRRVARPAHGVPAPAPPAAAVPAAAPAAPPRAEAAVEDLGSSTDSSDGSSSRRSHRGAAAPASRAHSAGPRPKAGGGALRPGSPANSRPRPASPPAAEAVYHGSDHRGRNWRPDAGGPVGAWPPRDNHSRAPRPSRRAIVGGPAVAAAPRHRSRSRARPRRPRR